MRSSYLSLNMAACIAAILAIATLRTFGSGAWVANYYQGQSNHSTFHGIEMHGNGRFEDSWLCFGGGVMFAVEKTSGAPNVYDAETLYSIRISPQTIVAPFVGIGFNVGYSSTERDDERPDSRKLYGSVFPEVGIRFWLLDTIVLECSGRYYISGSTRDNVAFWGVGIGFGER